jgi:hypothetical protein
MSSCKFSKVDLFFGGAAWHVTPSGGLRPAGMQSPLSVLLHLLLGEKYPSYSMPEQGKIGKVSHLLAYFIAETNLSGFVTLDEGHIITEKISRSNRRIVEQVKRVLQLERYVSLRDVLEMADSESLPASNKGGFESMHL